MVVKKERGGTGEKSINCFRTTGSDRGNGDSFRERTRSRGVNPGEGGRNLTSDHPAKRRGDGQIAPIGIRGETRDTLLPVRAKKRGRKRGTNGCLSGVRCREAREKRRVAKSLCLHKKNVLERGREVITR